MGSISKRRKRDGSLSYRAQVRVRKNGLYHNESATFSRRALAKDWIDKRERALEAPGALAAAQPGASTRIGDLIARYMDEYGAIRAWGRTKSEHLGLLSRMDLADWDAAKVGVSDLVDHVRRRRLSGTGPATVGNDLVWLGVVFRAAVGWGLPVNPVVVQEARTMARSMNLVGSARRRHRRPTADELSALADYFDRGDGRIHIPMHDIMWFAVYSARRQAEITRLQWADNDADSRTGLVRDAKHPRAKQGNHKRFKYTAEGWAIVQRQPRKHAFVFPYNSKSVGAAFTRACHMLGIHDLRFHDLRHEATSRLFERGYQIHEVAQFTLHESWQELQRYTQLRPENVREI